MLNIEETASVKKSSSAVTLTEQIHIVCYFVFQFIDFTVKLRQFWAFYSAATLECDTADTWHGTPLRYCIHSQHFKPESMISLSHLSFAYSTMKPMCFSAKIYKTSYEFVIKTG